VELKRDIKDPGGNLVDQYIEINESRNTGPTYIAPAGI